MKKLWIVVLVVAVVALVAMFAYSPQSSSDTNTQSPGSGSESAQSGQMVDDGDAEDDMEVEDDETSGSMTDTTSSGTNIEGSSKVTLSELSTHDSKNDCWISYKGEVYDITSFLPVHPGSSAAIEPYCGTSTEFENAFTKKHGTSKVSMLKQRGTFEGNLA